MRYPSIVVLVFGISLCINAQDILQATDACNCLSNEILSSVMDWEKAEIVKTDETFGRRRSICMIKSQSTAVVYVRLGWKSEKAQEKGVLSFLFKRYLTDGENGMSYSEIEGKDATQSLVASGNIAGGLTMAIARKRYGEKAEVQIEVSGENSKEYHVSLASQLLSEVK